MTDEKWEQLVQAAKNHFKDVALSSEDLFKDTPDGPQKEGTQDILEFEKQDERFRLVRENRPVILEKKQHFSHRMGDTARTEYKLSESEFSHKLKVYKEVGYDDWEEVTLDNLGM